MVASRLVPAFDSASRRTGLLKHTSLSADTALIIAPTNAGFTRCSCGSRSMLRLSKGRANPQNRGSPSAVAPGGEVGRLAVVEMIAGAFARCGTAPFRYARH